MSDFDIGTRIKHVYGFQERCLALTILWGPNLESIPTRQARELRWALPSKPPASYPFL